jgi:hypothetical protein
VKLLVAADDRVPSQVKNDAGVRALGAGSLGEIDLDASETTVGKWLLFIPSADHDETWLKIRDATKAGRLGVGAKAETALNTAMSPFAQGRVKLICVYTGDWTDEADVTRVLRELRALGFNGRLSYKTDASTLTGQYGSGSATYVSQPGSPDMERRR